MGSAASKGKPTGGRGKPGERPPARDEERPESTFLHGRWTANDPPVSLPPSYSEPGYIHPDDYDARDGFLNRTSDPFPAEPMAQNGSYLIDNNYGAPVQYGQRRLPQARPARAEVHGSQPFQDESSHPDTNAPQRPQRKIEAKEGQVTDDVIAVQEEPEAINRATQTQRVSQTSMSYRNMWMEDGWRQGLVQNHSAMHIPARRPYLMTSYTDYHQRHPQNMPVHRNYAPNLPFYPRRHMDLKPHPAHGSYIQRRHEVHQEYIERSHPVHEDAHRFNHNSVPSLIHEPIHNEPMLLPRGSVIPLRESAHPKRESVIPLRESAHPQRESVIPLRESAHLQRESVIPLRESAHPPRESVIPLREYALPPRLDANLRFYRNEIRFRPDGAFIDDIHRYWFGDYDRLEKVHTYIQWLFPLPDSSGTNPDAQPLQAYEQKEMVRDSRVEKRFLKSYILMLDFFGISLSNREFGRLQRAQTYKERFLHLNNSSHNYHRITRITKSIGFLGLRHYQLPFVTFLLNEVLVTSQLSNVRDSNLEQWIAAISDNREREVAMTFYINHINYHEKSNPSRTVTNKIEENDFVFDERHDYVDVNMDSTRKSFKDKNSELSEIPPISHGLSRGSR